MKKTIFILLVLPCIIFGASKTWDNGCANDSFACANNWVGDVVPASSDTAIFDSATSNANCKIYSGLTIRDIKLGNYSGIFSFNSATTISLTTSKTFFKNTGKSTIAGSASLAFSGSAANIIDTIDNFISSQYTGALTFRNGSGGTGICKTYIKRVLLPNSTSITVSVTTAADTNTSFYFIGDTVSSKLLSPGIAAAGAKDSIFYGSTIFDIGAYNASTNQTGYARHFWQSAKFNCYGNFTMPSADTCTVNIGTSTCEFDSSTNTTLTPNGRRFFRIVNNKTSTGTLTLASACTTSSHFTVSDGILKTATYPIFSDSNIIFSCNDTVDLSKLNSGKTISFGASTIPKFTTDSIVADSIYYASTNGDSIRGDFKIRKMVIANGSNFEPTTNASFKCTSCDGVTDLRDGKPALTVVYPTSGPISYDSNVVHYTVNDTIDSLRVTNSGCSGTYSVDTLPDGLCISTTTGIITGIPINIDTLQSIVTITNSGGMGKDTIVYNITGSIVTDTIPVISSITPTHGTFGTQVTVAGTTFGSAPSCYLNGGLVPHVSRDSISFVFNATDLGLFGEVPVVIKNNTYNTYDTINWSYDTIPNLASVNLPYGRTGGGDTRILYGTGMTGVDTLWVGTNKATITAKTDNSVTFMAPSGTAGVKDIRTFAEYGYRDTLTAAFTYDVIHGLAISPTSQKDTTAGTDITLTASYGLTGTALVSGSPFDSYSVLTDTTATAVSLAGSGVKPVRVYAGSDSSNTVYYRYVSNGQRRRNFSFMWGGFRF